MIIEIERLILKFHLEVIEQKIKSYSTLCWRIFTFFVSNEDFLEWKFNFSYKKCFEKNSIDVYKNGKFSAYLRGGINVWHNDVSF